MPRKSSTSCDLFWDLVSNYKRIFGKNFDQISFAGQGPNIVLGAALRNAKNGCELHRLSGTPEKCECMGFDEQLQFVSASGDPLSNIDYMVRLSNGYVAEGTTNDSGHTERIRTVASAKIEGVEFFLPHDVEPCCSKTRVSPLREPAKRIPLQNVRTNPDDLGRSVVKVVVKSQTRSLTAGERAMAWMIFRESLDYGTVKVHNETYGSADQFAFLVRLARRMVDLRAGRARFSFDLTHCFAPFCNQDGLRDSVIVKRLPASTRLAKANNVKSCAVFLARPR